MLRCSLRQPLRQPQRRGLCSFRRFGVAGLRFVKDVGEVSAKAIVSERERHGPYSGPSDLVRRTGLKPQAVESLVMAGGFDSLIPNRRHALWDTGLGIRPSSKGQRAFADAVNGDAPDLSDFTAHERMAGEYRVMGIYPRGHLMEFVRPGLGPQVLPAAAVDRAGEGEDSGGGLAHRPAGSTPRGKMVRYSSPLRTRPGTPRSSCGPRSSTVVAGSWAATCFWCGEPSPGGTGPPMSSPRKCGVSTPASPCPPPTTGAETGGCCLAAISNLIKRAYFDDRQNHIRDVAGGF